MQTKPGTEGPSGAILTFLIADIRGYTVFSAERGDEAAARLASRFAALVREGVEAHGGELTELRGDEALVVFDSARQAIRAAIDLQRRFVDETVADPKMPLAVGIGLDAGEAVPVEDGYRGGALNLAARLCSLAGPAEVLASREVVHLARKVEGVTTVDRGSVRLKGLPDPVQVIRLRAEAQDASEDMAFRRALGSSAARLSPAVPGAMVSNPYKGLRPFEEGDAPDFFGREALTQQLVERLRETRFLAVVGPSGSGKSSVARAGLIPALRRGALPGSEEWVIVEMLPGTHPLKELEASLLRVAVNPPSSLVEQLERDDQGLLWAVKRVLPAGDSELVLLIDQFEEVFTLVEDEAARTHFLESLEAAATDPHSRVRVLVTLRADFYDRPLLYRGFAELLRARVEVVVPLSPEEFERAISGPANRVDVRLERGLEAAMVADVADEPGALPLLQYALTELFERRDDSILTLDSYREISGVSGALGRRAEELYAGLDAAGKEAARQVFLRLVALGEGTEDTRRPVPRSELQSLDVDQQAMAAVIDEFGASRLLSFDRDSRTGAPTLEVAHEALLTAWPRLRRWIDDAREDVRTERRLGTASREWLEAERDPSFLVGGSRLEQLAAWLQGADISITPEEREFLEASIAERDRRRSEEERREARERELERRSLRRLRTLVAVLAAAALVASAITVFAFNQRGRAERESRIAVARELAAAAVANLEVDPERSILLAVQAVESTRSVDGTVLPEAEDALHRAVQSSRIVLSVPGIGGWLDWSPDGTRFVTEGPEETGIVDIRDAETGESLLSFEGHDVDVNGVAFSRDGSMLATTGDDGALRVWDPETGERLGNFEGPEGPVLGPSFSPDGSVVAACWLFEGQLRLWDLETGRMIRSLESLRGPFATSFSPDGQRLVVGALEPSVASVVDVPSGREAFTLRGQFDGVSDVDWSPDGRWIATAANDATVRVWSAGSGDLQSTLFGHTGPLADIEWSPDSTRLLTGGADGTARVWEISDAGALELLSLSAQDTRGGIQGVSFSPDGDRVMTGDSQIRATKIWDLSATGDAEWATLPNDVDFTNPVTFATGGELLAPGEAGSVAVWDPETGERLQTIDPENSSADQPPTDIAISPDGALVAIASPRGAEVRDMQTGDQLLNVSSGRFVDDVEWNADGTLLAVSLFDGGARVVDRSGADVAVLEEEPGLGVFAARFSPDGRLLVTAAAPTGRPDLTAQQVRIWDWERGDVLRTIETPVEGIALDPHGPRIAIAGPGGVEIWNRETGRRIQSLAGGTGGRLGVAFSADGALVAAGGFDETVRVWDARSGVQLLVLRGHEGPVDSVAFSADGSKLASGGADETVRVWALDLDDLIHIATEELTRGLTEAECRQYLHGPCPPA